MQALCFLAGANSIFVGDTLLTAGNPEDHDAALFGRLGIEALRSSARPAPPVSPASSFPPRVASVPAPTRRRCAR